MVTTIKITCDGVFIQSNSFLTSSSTPTSTTTTTDTINPQETVTSTDSNSSTSSLTDSSLLCKTLNSDKDKSTTSILECGKHHHLDSSNSSSPSSSSIRSCQKSLNSLSSNRGKRPRTPKSENRRRYYFGSNRIYWCKQSADRQLTCCDKSELSLGRNSSSTCLQRSASSVTHKELQQQKCHSHTSRSKHKPLTATSSLSSVPTNHHQQQYNRKPHTNYLNTFYNLNKCNSAALKTPTPKTISGGTSIFLINGFSVNSPAYNNNKYYASDTRLLSFLRSARKLYRNSVHLSNNTNQQQQQCFYNGDTSSAENTKVSYNSANNLKISKTKSNLDENSVETKLHNNNSLTEKIKQTYIFGVKSLTVNNYSKYYNNNNNYFNNRNKSKNAKNNGNNCRELNEEWFG